MNFIKIVKSLLPKQKEEIQYTHWDLHVLARALAPAAWAAFDAMPEINPATGRKKYYMDNVKAEPVSSRMTNIGTYDSFMMAVNALMAGYKIPHPHLLSDEELQQHLNSKA